MKKINLLLIIALIAIFTGCEKTPVANFSITTVGGGSLVAGVTLQLNNTSQNMDHCQWTMPDGSTSTEISPTYTTSTCDALDITFNLEAYSKNGNKTGQLSNTVDIIPATGNITFWSTDQYSITVTFNGETQSIANYYTSDPGYCDVPGCVNFDGLLYCNDYSWSATDGTTYWSDDYIPENSCWDIELIPNQGIKLSNPFPGNKINPISEQYIATHTNKATVKSK